jgi:hypothetical protein
MNETGWFGQSLAESPGWTLSAVGSEFQLNALGSSFSCTASQPWAGSEGWAAPKEKEEAKRAGGQVASSWRWRTDLFPFFFLQIKVVRADTGCRTAAHGRVEGVGALGVLCCKGR